MEDVYHLPEFGNPSRVKGLLQQVLDIEKNSLVAVKLHMGELINYRFIRPPFVREIVAEIKKHGGKPFLTDCTTLYSRGRFNAVDYLETASRNGFNSSTIGAPVIISDGLCGEKGVMVETGGELIDEIEMGQSIYEADYLVALTHCTGHISTGYGGAIKNIGMGCMTKNGKRAVHRFSMPEVDREKCEKCRACIKSCPYSVIHMKEFPEICANWCVGCSRCVRACPSGAMHHPQGWFRNYIKALVEAANSVIKKFGNNIAFINFLTDITEMCDCALQKEALVEDLGALASTDIVGIDQASYDMIKKHVGRDILHEVSGVDGELQFDIGEKLGMGNRKYKIRDIK